MGKKLLICIVLVLLISVAVPPQTAVAFDTGPHFDLTWDALSAEGFGETAIQVAQVTNWMTDFYEQASQNPYSGRSDWWKELLTGAYGWREHWPDSVVNAADWLHFDSTPNFLIGGQRYRLENGEAVAMEWARLARATRRTVRDMAAAGDVLGLLTVLGISTHAVQDFYAHTNWVEPMGSVFSEGVDGPGWAQQGLSGSHPIWFDVPAEVRQAARIYAVSQTPYREHGYWNDDENRSLKTAVNKDWPGRPYYQDAYLSTYFATRQWVRAVRFWVNDEAFWQAAQQFSDGYGGQLSRDVAGAFAISFNAGHWQGQGEPTGADRPGPGGSLDDLMSAISVYHQMGKSVFRSKFEQVVLKLAEPAPPDGEQICVPAACDMTAAIEFVAIKVTHVHDATAWDEVGIDVGPDEADFYTRADIAGQDFVSAMIHGYDTFDFSLPNYPFTFIKAVPKTWQIDEPVTTLRVTVGTADAEWAGTDDDVFLRINDRTRFELDTPLYNDFESGDVDTYSLVPPQGLRIRDIQYIQIEKSSDGVAGGWKLDRVALWVNGDWIYDRGGIDTWLEDDQRTWRAPDFRAETRTTEEIPITLQLYDSDGKYYFEDDHCDIHPDCARYDLHLLYDTDTGRFRGDLSGTTTGASQGGASYGGRGDDSDRAAIAFTVETYRVHPDPRCNIGDQAEIYVDGSNTCFEDGTAIQPFNTVGEGVSALSAGVRKIRIAGGVYPGRLLIETPCTLETWQEGSVVIGE